MIERRKVLTNNLILRVIGILVVIAITLQTVILVRPRAESVPGRIIYLRENRMTVSSATELVLIDGDGNREQRLGEFTASPTWSHDGRYIAVGCGDTPRICILDALTIPDTRNYPTGNIQLSPDTVAELDMPQPCVDLGSHIVSISWAPTNLELALLCSDEPREIFEVCTLSLGNESTCWDRFASDGVRQIEWSPTNANQFVISGGPGDTPEIFLTNRNGEDRVFLDYGWSPAWSSDGKQIAFFRWKDGVQEPDEEQWFGGIAAIHPDGTELTWLYQPWTIPIDPVNNIYFGCNNTGCSLDWSPDDRYIVFTGNYIGMYDTNIFRLEIDSGEIIFLTNQANLYRHNLDPDWGP